MPILTAAYVFILQSDSGASPAATPGGSTSFSALTDLFGNIGPVAILVLLTLLLASLYSWTVILGIGLIVQEGDQGEQAFHSRVRKASQLKGCGAGCQMPIEPSRAGIRGRF